MIKIAIDLLLYSARCSQSIMHINVIILSSNITLLTNNNNNIIVKDEWLHTITPTHQLSHKSAILVNRNKRLIICERCRKIRLITYSI